MPEATRPNEPCLGILKLDTRFPRPPGDTGNAVTFPFPVRYAVVAGASPRRVVCERAAGLLDPFIAAGRRLIEQGAVGIATTCGFLTLFQQELAAALPVPVATSSLMQVAWVAPMLRPGKRVGLITINADSLSPDHLAAVGVPLDIPYEGVAPGAEFRERILEDVPVMDFDEARRNVVDCARRLVARHPEVGAIVMECTNMPPYRKAVIEATGLPVYDALTLAEWLWQGLPRGGARF
jgi:Asp/Glu/hydantoin racemase